MPSLFVSKKVPGGDGLRRTGIWEKNMKYSEMTASARSTELARLTEQYKEVQAKKLKLDMSRGKPEARQATLSEELLTVLNKRGDLIGEGGDYANYGTPDGIPEAKAFVADVVGAEPEEVILWNNASLEIMYFIIATGYARGLHGEEPWCKQSGRKFLCPVPGYDRHFAITEHFGFEMINIAMDDNGPDMDRIEELVKDPSVKGIWCVPLYSNPGGCCYSDETVRRFAALKPAAKDFCLIWDNAYIVHHLYPEQPVHLLNLLDEAKKQGTLNNVFELFSTSKITIAGDGMAALISSPENLKELKSEYGLMTVGFDKINQLRTVRFLKNKENLEAHMAKHAALLCPKFEAVERTLEEELGALGIARWTKPRGGYFISLNTMPGCAKRVVELCKEAGVVLTPAGSTYPYKKDPEDSNIRIAPTYPSPENLAEAAKILTLCVKIASLEKLR